MQGNDNAFEILELWTERKFGRESEGPQWVQCKALVRVQVEAPQPILDLVNFDLLLRVFPNFKIVSRIWMSMNTRDYSKIHLN
jgi:hypothetical protein